jgi:hypothetical protein
MAIPDRFYVGDVAVPEHRYRRYIGILDRQRAHTPVPGWLRRVEGQDAVDNANWQGAEDAARRMSEDHRAALRRQEEARRGGTGRD